MLGFMEMFLMTRTAVTRREGSNNWIDFRKPAGNSLAGRDTFRLFQALTTQDASNGKLLFHPVVGLRVNQECAKDMHESLSSVRVFRVGRDGLQSSA